MGVHHCELQIVHQKMFGMRKRAGGHDDYAKCRAAAELLEVLPARPPSIIGDLEAQDLAEVAAPSALPSAAANESEPPMVPLTQSSLRISLHEPAEASESLPGHIETIPEKEEPESRCKCA